MRVESEVDWGEGVRGQGSDARCQVSGTRCQVFEESIGFSGQSADFSVLYHNMKGIPNSSNQEVIKVKKTVILIMALAMVFSMLTVVPAAAEETGETLGDRNQEAPAAEETEEIFAEWNKGAPALEALIAYVEDVTDESSPNYIPPVDRIAVFDMDGTLCGELYPTYLEYYMLARRIFCDPSYTPDEEMLEFGRILRDHALDKSFPDHMDLLHANAAAKAYAGMTLTQFADFVTNQLVRDVDGFEGMTYATSFYLPMIEVVEYLEDNGFKVYVCSGSDRFLCRTFIEGMLDIPYERIIGMDVVVEAANQGDTDGLDYMYTSEDDIVRTDMLLIKNLKMNKVRQIVQEIGRQPVLSFGNSSGDMSMHNYVLYNNRYKSAAFMLIADDEERDYGNTEKAQGLREKWEAAGYVVISMKDDFRTIYGDDVVKTGTFHWLEEFSEDRSAGQPTADNPYMQTAIDEAVEGITNQDGGPFGAVVVRDGEIVGRGHNRVLANNDPTCHGEVSAIRDACTNLGTYDLSGCELYTTGEPCPMCLYACMWANIDLVYYGCTIADNAMIGFRDEKFDSLAGGREQLADYLVCIDRNACLDLFEMYAEMSHVIY